MYADAKDSLMAMMRLRPSSEKYLVHAWYFWVKFLIPEEVKDKPKELFLNVGRCKGDIKPKQVKIGESFLEQFTNFDGVDTINLVIQSQVDAYFQEFYENLLVEKQAE